MTKQYFIRTSRYYGKRAYKIFYGDLFHCVAIEPTWEKALAKYNELEAALNNK